MQMIRGKDINMILVAMFHKVDTCICGFAIIVAHIKVQITIVLKMSIFIDLGIFCNICCVLHLNLSLLQSKMVHMTMRICTVSSANNKKRHSLRKILDVNITKMDAELYTNIKCAIKADNRSPGAEK